jgi:PadR family transcriptional regulator, regulatory protein PadR
MMLGFVEVKITATGAAGRRPRSALRRSENSPNGMKETSYTLVALYIALPLMKPSELQQNSAEIVILALLEDRPRHGYELAKLVEAGSGSLLQYQVASIYPMLHRLERKGMVQGKWVEKPEERRRRFYSLTKAGRAALAAQRIAWNEFFTALNRLTRFSDAT